MPDFDYQLVVIGSGPGGYIAAIRASQLGLKTAIVEKDKTLGGTCLNVGCIPSKALLASTEHLHFAKERFAAHGIITGDIKVDLGTMMKRKLDVVSKLTGGVAYLMKKNKIEVVKGFGKPLDANTVEVTDDGGGKKTLKTQNILLATGSVPIELPFLKFDGKRVISSDQGIALESVPKKLLVIGAGAIGLELGSVWARLGAEVTVIEFFAPHRRDRLRRGNLENSPAQSRKDRHEIRAEHENRVGEGQRQGGSSCRASRATRRSPIPAISCWCPWAGSPSPPDSISTRSA